MPRFVTRDDLSRSRGESRSIIQGPSNGIGRAIQSFAQGVDAFGNVAAREVDEERQKDQALDLTKARSAFQIGLMQARAKYKFENDQDQDTWAKRFEDDGKIVHEKAGELIRDPVLKERFLADTLPDVERNRIEVDESAGVIRRQRRVTESDTALEQSLELAGGADTPESTQRAVLDDMLASVDGLVKTGTITPEMGAARRIDITRKFAARRVLADQQADPARTLRWLRGTGKMTDDEAAEEHLRDKEGFLPTPKMDGDTLRIGHGSDTITTEDGKVLKVVPGMRISRADADRDLARRRKETQNGIKRDIGTDQWNGLSRGAKVALTGMAYNYGSLPDSVVAAARTGDPAKIAAAIRARAGDKGNGIPGFNAKRRFEEAALVEGGKVGKDRPAYYDFLSAEDKLKLTKASEGDVADQDQAIEKAAREAEADARVAAEQAKGALDLGIEQGTTSRASILNAPIDDGDKATLLRRFDENASASASAAQVWDAVSRGAPLPDKPEKGLDKLFKDVGGAEALVGGDPKAAATVGLLWDKAQAMPPAAKTALTGMIQSSDQERAIAGLGLLDKLQRSNPQAFDATFDDATAKALSYYQDRVGFESAASIFAGMRKASDPQTIKMRQPLIEDARKILNKEALTAEDIAGKFDSSILPMYGTPGIARGTVNTPQGRTGIMDAANLERDYNRLFEEAYADDPRNAEKNALKMLGRTWGVSAINNGNLMRFPPDKYLPRVNGTHEWATEALEKDLIDLGYKIASGKVTRGKAEELVRNYVVQPIPATESDIASGQSPRYAIMVMNPDTGEYDIALNKKGQMLTYRWDAAEASEQARRSFQLSHARAKARGPLEEREQEQRIEQEGVF